MYMMQRSILYDLKDEIVPPTNETVAQVFARLSAYRDAMDGPQVLWLLQVVIAAPASTWQSSERRQACSFPS